MVKGMVQVLVLVLVLVLVMEQVQVLVQVLEKGLVVMKLELDQHSSEKENRLSHWYHMV